MAKKNEQVLARHNILWWTKDQTTYLNKSKKGPKYSAWNFTHSRTKNNAPTKQKKKNKNTCSFRNPFVNLVVNFEMIAFCDCCYVSPRTTHLPATIAVNCGSFWYLLQQYLRLNAIFISIFYVPKTPSRASQHILTQTYTDEKKSILCSIMIMTHRFSDFGFETFRKKMFFCLSFPLTKKTYKE